MEKNLEMRKLWSFYTPERCNLKIHPKLQEEIHLKQTPRAILGVIFSWIWVILGDLFTDCTMGFITIWAARIAMSSHEQPGYPFPLLNEEQRVATWWGWFAPTSHKTTIWENIFLHFPSIEEAKLILFDFAGFFRCPWIFSKMDL